MKTFYLTPTDWIKAKANQPRDAWRAEVAAGDPTQSIVEVLWDNPNHEVAFEANPEVVHIGMPWEPIDPTILSVITPPSAQAVTMGPLAPTADTPPPNVYNVLRGLGWGAARFNG